MTWNSVTRTELGNSERVTEFPARVSEILRYAQDDPKGRIATSSRSRVMARNDALLRKTGTRT